MRKIKWFCLSSLFLSSMLLGQNPSPVRAVPVKKENITERTSVTGSLRASLSSDIASIESGRIDEFLVQEGQWVKNGDILAKLDSRRIRHEINSLNAQINESKARIERFRNELKIHQDEVDSLLRAEKDFSGSVSRQEIRNSRLTKVSAEGEITTLEATLVTLQTQLESLYTSLSDTEIKAVFDGVITRKFVELGSWVAAGDKVVTLMSDQKLEAWLDIPESIDYGNFTEDLISIEANNLPLKINNFSVVPQISEPSRNYKLIVEVEGQGHKLVPGMSLNATVPNGRLKDQLLIPADAISRNGAGYFVFKAQQTPDGTIALPVRIEVLFQQGTLVAVSSEMLQPEDLVITEGNERLFPMTPVMVLSEEKK